MSNQSTLKTKTTSVFKSMKFTTKLLSSIILLCLVSILITSGNAIRMADNGLQSLGEESVENIHNAMLNSLKLLNGTIQAKLDGDLGLFSKELKTKGQIIFDNYNSEETTIVNQVTKKEEKAELPQMMAGGSYISGKNDIVDAVEKATGSSATIFQLVEDKLVRISTTVKKNDGNRAIGSYIPSDSPVYQTIMKGEAFKGKAFVVNDWYLTAYAPLLGGDGKVVGAIYVGQLMITPILNDFLNSTKIGNGYFYLYSETGEILIHPTIAKGTNIFTNIPVLQGHKDGMLHYTLDNQERISFVKYYEDWGVYLNASTTKEDIIGGRDLIMLRNNLLVGVGVIFVGIIISMLLVRTINRPLQDLAGKSVKVGEGDYTITFESSSNDAIGQLAQSLGLMVEKSKAMLEDVIVSTKALSESSWELSAISEEMVSSADATTGIADEASTNAANVSDNMDSISAAMGQSTSNLDMIAAASEEMGNTIREIAENSSHARVTTEQAVASAQKSHDGVQKLGEAAKAIGTVTATITEISDQTNLLALNATIEAARAGEAGKGFAVVANEIKELAKQTALATGKISDAIEEMQRQTGETVSDIESITKVIEDVNEVVNSIVTAVEEQSITTNEIVNNVAQASRGISEINENVANSSSMTTMMSEGVQQVRTRSMEVKSSSELVRASSDQLSKLATDLTELVSKFKIS
ncbi:methyl-accepting chemotaxis protein [Desulfopila aestuarii DSM 18488]|uniref:Methyl-accepting chemotaxis protein n=1 Tax=Desulfopila aestuarii DSM 18488 TaxID=1121416 RepID=A0A1M7YA44_9BACT|nr:methyl-accepting chemotaxis protein [Desulfopila aestuarii DSM 18488]